MELLKVLKCRKSVRSYTGAVSEQDVQDMLYAGAAAPVGRGKFETMHMTVVENKELLEKLDRNAAEFMGDLSRRPLYGAPRLILISSKIAEGGNCLGNVQYSNAAIMAEHMALAAIQKGLGSCLIWGAVAALNTKPELLKELGLPDGHVVCCGVVFGETEEELPERDIDTDRISVSYVK